MSFFGSHMIDKTWWSCLFLPLQGTNRVKFPPGHRSEEDKQDKQVIVFIRVTFCVPVLHQVQLVPFDQERRMMDPVSADSDTSRTRLSIIIFYILYTNCSNQLRSEKIPHWKEMDFQFVPSAKIDQVSPIFPLLFLHLLQQRKMVWKKVQITSFQIDLVFRSNCSWFFFSLQASFTHY